MSPKPSTLPASLAPVLAEAARTASAKAYVLLNGTLLPTDRSAADQPSYSGKHPEQGMTVQVIDGPASRLLWASPALPGAVHDVRTARENGAIDALGRRPLPCPQEIPCLHHATSG
ncbi:hypothetical protein GCM10011578_096290 [Streptomyces fuscichromogenes]|uniref:DDE Tnp4 domain-containing protein n=1 Tax=Streptomyces fuscichromogenes TaxID=1324013 RepID=A0A918CXD9_9ACTN|nr:hypothetical protein GCM10011578_096290 [Streptomyces fuscichromogenes]